MPHPGYFTPGMRPGTHCTGGYMGPREVWMGAGNLAPHWDLIPFLSSP